MSMISWDFLCTQMHICWHQIDGMSLWQWWIGDDDDHTHKWYIIWTHKVITTWLGKGWLAEASVWAHQITIHNPTNIQARLNPSWDPTFVIWCHILCIVLLLYMIHYLSLLLTLSSHPAAFGLFHDQEVYLFGPKGLNKMKINWNGKVIGDGFTANKKKW